MATKAQIQTQADALREERRGYEHRQKKAQENGDTDVAKAMTDRLAQVDAVLKRIDPDGTTAPPSDRKPGRERAVAEQRETAVDTGSHR